MNAREKIEPAFEDFKAGKMGKIAADTN